MIHGIFLSTGAGELHIPKLVFSLWLLPELRGCVVGLAYVLTNRSTSTVSELTLLMTDELRDAVDISQTLLDPTNPLSTRYTGQYEVGSSDTLALYDGVPDVRVSWSRLSPAAGRPGLYTYRHEFSPVAPGESVAVRIVAALVPGGSVEARDDGELIELRFFDTSELKQPPSGLGSPVPVWAFYDAATLDGGFDIFLYVPDRLRVRDARPEFHRLNKRQQYNWLGSHTDGSWDKYVWKPHLSMTGRRVEDLDMLRFVHSNRIILSCQIEGRRHSLGERSRSTMEDSTEQKNSRRPTVFISYSRENEAHIAWVRQLAEALTEGGCFVKLDQWDLTLGFDLLRYMETSVREADRVILVCTPAFARKSNDRSGGVGWESIVVTGEIYNGTAQSKFIPLLRSGSVGEALPSYLKGSMYLDMRGDDEWERGIGVLLDDIHGRKQYARPAITPAIS